MSTAALLVDPNLDNRDRWLFEFNHAQAHRSLFDVMQPLDRFSVLPYQLDPTTPQPIPPLPQPAGDWPMRHQQAHNDLASAIGIQAHQNLVDVDMNDERSRQWWIFANHQEHYIASQTRFRLLTEAGIFPS